MHLQGRTIYTLTSKDSVEYCRAQWCVTQNIVALGRQHHQLISSKYGFLHQTSLADIVIVRVHHSTGVSYVIDVLHQDFEILNASHARVRSV